jgi:hypothetical protein
MQALITRYVGVTEKRDSFIQVIAERGRRTCPWQDSYDAQENHRRAAETVLRVWKWYGHWVGGGTPDQRGYAFACVPGSYKEGFLKVEL